MNTPRDETLKTFTPKFSQISSRSPTATVSELAVETGVYSATPEFVRKNCGPIANSILDDVPDEYFSGLASCGLLPNIDIRIHRLYPGDYPAYPGWHCDGVYRETYFGQPDLSKTKVSQHLTCCVSSEEGGVSSPEFLIDPVTLRFPVMEERSTSSQHTAWGCVNKQLEEMDNRPKSTIIPEGDLVQFDSWTIHRVSPARVRGWRLFFRLAGWYRPNLGQGQITKQEQVYKMVTGGW